MDPFYCIPLTPTCRITFRHSRTLTDLRPPGRARLRLVGAGLSAEVPLADQGAARLRSVNAVLSEVTHFFEIAINSLSYLQYLKCLLNLYHQNYRIQISNQFHQPDSHFQVLIL